MGLPDSERIVRILVHPKNGDVVYACVPGKLWSDSAERGVYKTTRRRQDAGRSCSRARTSRPAARAWRWTRETRTRCSPACGTSGARAGRSAPAATDPTRRAAAVCSRTTDGGKTWTALTAATHKGLPAEPWGRVEVAYAPSDAKVVYALVESKDSALYRSDDGGATWEARDKSQGIVWRPFYFARLVVDPKNPDRVFKPSRDLVVSEDGGRSFTSSGGRAHGDWHDLWIDPDNPKHVIGGDDGGLWISYDGGNRWWKTAQPADLAVLPREPRRQGPVPRLRRAAGQQLLGRDRRRRRAASRTRSGRTSTAATASGRWSTRPTPTRSTPSRRAATSAASTAGPAPRATSSRRRATRRSCASTGTRRSTPARRRRARSTSAASSCSARATAATPGSASRPT